MRPIVLLLCLPLGACSIRHDPNVLVSPQRPTVSSDTTITAAGTYELEAGLVLDPGDTLALNTTLKLGLDEVTDVFVGWTPYAHIDRPGDDGTGTGDSAVGARRRVWEKGPNAVAVQMATKLPTGDEGEGLSSGEIDFFLAGILSHEEDSGATLVGFYELGLIGEPGASDTGTQHTAALAASKPWKDDMTLFGELSKRHAAFGDDPLLAILGIAKRTRPGLVYDGALAVGLNDDAADLTLLFGLTTNVGRSSTRRVQQAGE